jgi:hypothetical protein
LVGMQLPENIRIISTRFSPRWSSVWLEKCHQDPTPELLDIFGIYTLRNILHQCHWYTQENSRKSRTVSPAIVQLVIWYTYLKYLNYVNMMCSHCLFPVVDKSGTSCYVLVSMLMTVTQTRKHVVPTSLISSARNKLLTSWQQARSNLLRTACVSLVETTCIANLLPSSTL